MTKPVIGLLGGLGSGKSTVATELARHGGWIINADHLGHEALRQPNLRDRIIAHFGTAVVDEGGQIDRRLLGSRVFANPSERRALEAIVHPWIGQRIQEELARAKAMPEVRFIILDAAIMLEAGWNKVCDWLVYIDVPRALRLERLAQQRGWSESEVTAREAAQMPLEQKASLADFTVDNAGSPAATARQVEQLLRQAGLLPTTAPSPEE